jgi:hypothetical protein
MEKNVDNQYVECMATYLGGYTDSLQSNLRIISLLLDCKFVSDSDNTFDSETIKRPNILILKNIKSEGYSKIKHVAIKLCGNDTFEITFYKRGNVIDSVIGDVYCDQLQNIVSEKLNMIVSNRTVVFN